MIGGENATRLTFVRCLNILIDMDLRGSVVLVTGGAGALGSVVAQRFFAAGARLALPVRSPGDVALLPAVLRSDSSRLHTGVAQLTEEAQVRTFVSEVVARWSGIDVLLNLAGGYSGGEPVERTAHETWEQMIASNLTTMFLVSREVIPAMRAKGGGCIVSVAAETALSPRAGQGAYATAKGGVLTMTSVLAQELRGAGISVNAIAPGILDTPANARAMPDADRQRWVRLEDVASVLLFLCSPEGRAVTGTTLRMPGGG
jgi:NAD(P)-dependent dehydrogenase (short-subunit alcohol dehydrogenase family)